MNKEKLVQIIDHYLEYRKENPETWMAHCKNQDNLKDAIGFAATARNHQGKKNRHQWRLKNSILEEFAERVKTQSSEFLKISSFDELLQKVITYKIKGIGSLTLYDTAERIGTYLNVQPDKIYLHAGTKIGAEKILKKRLKSKFIQKKDLPIAFQKVDLTCGEIEDILCIYKGKFNDGKKYFDNVEFSYCGSKSKKIRC